VQIEGSCHCGQITFTAEVDPSRVVVCHCSDCQVLSGSPFRIIVPAPMQSFVVRGEPRRDIKIADSGNRRVQAFCPECATPLFGAAYENAEYVTVRLGCVKQRAALTPHAQIWTRSSLPWLRDILHLPACEQQ
jgi:hypothetical protein